MLLAGKRSPLSLTNTFDSRIRRLQGYLDLQADHVDQRTVLTRKAFKAPIHISKPYWDDHSLLVNVMSPTAGLLRGDEVDVKVSVGQNASLLLSSPTALRIHKMEDGIAIWNQKFSVADGALLEYNPEWLMLQEGSSLSQSTTLTLSRGAELFFIESYAAGRVAHGESFSFKRFTNRFELYYDSQLSSFESYTVSPSSARPQPWLLSENPFFASIIIVSPKLSDESKIWDEIYSMNDTRLLIGSSRLATGPCWNVRVLSDDPVKTRAILELIRMGFYRETEKTPSKIRR